jgi:hypothetical protein
MTMQETTDPEFDLSNEQFRNAMSDLQLSLKGMAATLGVGRRMIAYYRKDMPVPRHVSMATRLLLHRRGLEVRRPSDGQMLLLSGTVAVH